MHFWAIQNSSIFQQTVLESRLLEPHKSKYKLYMKKIAISDNMIKGENLGCTRRIIYSLVVTLTGIVSTVDGLNNDWFMAKRPVSILKFCYLD